ncbi:MAG: corrinoid protein [Deltaproteobacteria bacterium]|nr:corrinoid protein [Deltaproteobacteria bacterium]MBW2577373.1 corrinoid protein [Deltaproteobacteria bacterium]MBW2693781.1 corrinoid protein [Deltaproteobacteria bacterium]
MSIEDIFQSILQLKRGEIADLVQAEIDAKTDVGVILEQGLINAMGEVGDQFTEGKLFVPEMLRAAETMKIGLEVLRPLLIEADINPRGTVIVGTVKGDLHDIGKNLVGMMLEGAGFTVVDLGVDVEPKAFLDAAGENQAELVAMSALLTTTMPVMAQCIEQFKEANMGARILVGGAPVNQDFAIKISADGYSSDAPGAVELAKNLVPA